MTRTRRVAVLLISIALLGLVFYATCIALQKAVANRQQERTGTFMGSDSRTSASMPVVYVASPLGFSAATRKFMNDQLIPSIGKAGVRPVNPWDASEEVQKKIEEAKDLNDLRDRRVAWEAVIEALGQRNAHAIEKADGVVAVLDGIDVDSGTAAEIGYATALGKWVIGYRDDLRRTGEDPTAEVNLQVEYFIRKHRGVIVHSLPELAEALQNRHEQKEK